MAATIEQVRDFIGGGSAIVKYQSVPGSPPVGPDVAQGVVYHQDGLVYRRTGGNDGGSVDTVTLAQAVAFDPTAWEFIAGGVRPGTGAGSLIIGGDGNTAPGDAAIVVGGSNNTAASRRSLVFGGLNNIVNGADCASYNSNTCTIDASLTGVVLVNCNAFDAPLGVNNITYINNAPAGSGGAVRDIYAVGDDAAVVAAVTDSGNTWVKGDLTAYVDSTQQDAGAPEAQPGQAGSILVGMADVVTGDTFDALDGNGYVWRYTYGTRNDQSSGWTRLRKAGPVILASPNGSLWAVTVNDAGNLVTTPI